MSRKGEKYLIQITLTSIAILLLVKSNVEAQQNYTIRLRGNGATSYQGRVEVYFHNQWLTVCKDYFNQSAANVICSELNFTRGHVRNVSHFGPGTLSTWRFQCGSTDIKLIQCIQDNLDQLNLCSHNEDVGVVCSMDQNDGDMRIVDSPSLPGSGFVEVFYDGNWRAVCNDDWSATAAKVVCKGVKPSIVNRKGYLPGAPAAVTSSAWINVKRTFAITSVKCTGTEDSLLNCSFSNKTTNCKTNNVNKYAAVTCVDLPNKITTVPKPDLSCQNNSFRAYFSRLATPQLHERDLILASNVTCNLNKNTSADHITLTFRFDDCGTINKTNATHISFENKLRYEHKYHLPRNQTPPLYPEMVDTYLIDLQCNIDRRVNASRCMIPVTETVTQSSTGKFIMKMYFYYNNSFQTSVQTYPLRIRLNAWLGVTMVLQTTDPGLKLVAYNCTATPNAISSHPVRQPLFENKCKVLPTLSFYNFNATTYGFYYRTFKFLHYDSVCIHCDALVCLASENTPQCDRACGTEGRRQKRQAEEPNISTLHFRSPVFYIVDNNTSDGDGAFSNEFGNGKVHIKSTISPVVEGVYGTLNKSSSKHNYEEMYVKAIFVILSCCIVTFTL